MSLKRAVEAPTPPVARDVEMARRSQRPGGLAALVQALTFVVGFVIYGTVVAGGSYGDPALPAATHVEFLRDHEVVLQAWFVTIYLVFGTALVVLAPAVGDRIRSHSPVLARAATTFGLIWAVLMFAVGMTVVVGNAMVVELSATDPSGAASLWQTMQLVGEGMGGGIELVGGLWIGLASWAALRARALPAALGWVGVVTGAAGVASTALVATEVVTSIFGLGCIVWFNWVGVHLLRAERP